MINLKINIWIRTYFYSIQAHVHPFRPKLGTISWVYHMIQPKYLRFLDFRAPHRAITPSSTLPPLHPSLFFDQLSFLRGSRVKHSSYTAWPSPLGIRLVHNDVCIHCRIHTHNAYVYITICIYTDLPIIRSSSSLINLMPCLLWRGAHS